MAYFCLTVVEARSGPKGQKRPNAAKQLKVEPKVLSKLGELSSQVGDNQKARKWGIHLRGDHNILWLAIGGPRKGLPIAPRFQALAMARA